MCLIVAKPKGVAVPSVAEFELWFKAHPDGAGLMFNDHGSVHIMKGLMSIDEVLLINDTIATLVDTTNTDIVWHFRQATKGTVKPENTHPYPISNLHIDLTALDVTCNIGIAHNGVIWEYNEKIAKDKLSTHTDVTDTQLFISEHLYDMRKGLRNPHIKKFIGVFTNSKFALLDMHGIDLIGDFIEDKGIYYSNNGYLPSQAFAYTYTYDGEEMDYAYCNKVWKVTQCDYCGETDVTFYAVNGALVCSECYKIMVDDDDDDEDDEEDAYYRLLETRVQNLKIS